MSAKPAMMLERRGLLFLTQDKQDAGTSSQPQSPSSTPSSPSQPPLLPQCERGDDDGRRRGTRGIGQSRRDA